MKRNVGDFERKWFQHTTIDFPSFAYLALSDGNPINSVSRRFLGRGGFLSARQIEIRCFTSQRFTADKILLWVGNCWRSRQNRFVSRAQKMINTGKKKYFVHPRSSEPEFDQTNKATQSGTLAFNWLKTSGRDQQTTLKSTFRRLFKCRNGRVED